MQHCSGECKQHPGMLQTASVTAFFSLLLLLLLQASGLLLQAACSMQHLGMLHCSKQLQASGTCSMLHFLGALCLSLIELPLLRAVFLFFNMGWAVYQVSFFLYS
jgi:hypothetical protein